MMLIKKEFEEFKELQEFKEREPGASSQEACVRHMREYRASTLLQSNQCSAIGILTTI
jgi:hypothetical protein